MVPFGKEKYQTGLDVYYTSPPLVSQGSLFLILLFCSFLLFLFHGNQEPPASSFIPWNWESFSYAVPLSGISPGRFLFQGHSNSFRQKSFVFFMYYLTFRKELVTIGSESDEE